MKKVLLGIFIICFSANLSAQTMFEYEKQAASGVYDYTVADEFTADGFIDNDPQVYNANPGGQTECIPGKPEPDCCYDAMGNNNIGDLSANNAPSLKDYCPVGSGVFATIIMGLGYVFFRSRRKE